MAASRKGFSSFRCVFFSDNSVRIQNIPTAPVPFCPLPLESFPSQMLIAAAGALRRARAANGPRFCRMLIESAAVSRSQQISGKSVQELNKPTQNRESSSLPVRLRGEVAIGQNIPIAPVPFVPFRPLPS
uniref:(northern house mosquito) hypothetical protein n=1 Tax=Culex pipiens TaxID=7175 RepID=A0A8D8D2J8_CULPI